MRRIKRMVTVTFEYDDASEAVRHRLIMRDDGWDARVISEGYEGGEWITEYTLEMADE